MELDGRRQLMEDAGLKDVVANAYKLDVRADSRGRVQRNGCNGLTRAKVHVIAPVFKDQSSGRFLRDASSVPKDMLKNTCYGVYAGTTA